MRAQCNTTKATMDQVVRAKQVANERLQALDANGDGVLQYDEVMKGYEGVDSSIKDELKAMFKENDYNGDGVVSKRELFQLALRMIMLGQL